MNLSFPVLPRSAASRGAVLPLLTLALAALGTGCYHATGYQRPPLMATEIPATGGDRVSGIKAAAGPGDYYMGNDYVAVAIDGTAFGEKAGSAIAGALSGGSLVDVGSVTLDSSYKQTPLSSDLMERLTPVVNQDPSLPLVFTSYSATNLEDRAYIEMHGSVYDAAGLISGGIRDNTGRLTNVEVTHRVHLGKLNTYVVLETVLKNTGSGTIGIRNIADALLQQGAGYRFNIPATETYGGQALQGWGVSFAGTDFSKPLENSVKAPMIALMGTEPADFSTDMHTSLGLIADDWKPMLVATDAQDPLTNFRPEFAKRLVAGCLPVNGLGAGESLTYRRRLYIQGGQSTSAASPYSNQATYLFNRMAMDQATAQEKATDMGVLFFTPFGTASRMAGTPTQFRFERNTGTGDKPVWSLERSEWWEPLDTPAAGSFYSRLIAGASVSQAAFELALPKGSYRVVAFNGKGERIEETRFHDSWSANERLHSLMPLVIDHDKPFQVATTDVFCPERDSILTATGNQSRPILGSLSFSSAIGNSVGYQPARFTVVGLKGTPDPNQARARVVTGYYSAAYKQKLPGDLYTAAYLVGGGNTLFGVNFRTAYSLNVPFGSYRTYASHGPLAPIDQAEATLDSYYVSGGSQFTSFEPGIPTGWVSFDIPGPTMATTGGIHPFESLSSALAEAVDVVGYVEEDQYPDITKIRNEFRYDFNLPSQSTEVVKVLGIDPLMVGGRQSRLTGKDTGSDRTFGTVSTLFDLQVEPATRRNGARISTGWTLADFLNQGGGSFSVVHDPRGPQGLFTLQGFDPKVPVGTGANAWWNRTTALSGGRTHGSFDALELLRGEGVSVANAGAWWTTFKTVRQDWFALLNQQGPTAFTKALGLSASHSTLDTPAGLARTYVQATSLTQDTLSTLKDALKKGAAVASTGPLLDVKVNGSGPGSLVTGGSVSVAITAYAPTWVPVDEVRIVWNGQVVKTLKDADFTYDATDGRKRTATATFSAPKDGWVVVEAGAPLDAATPYRPDSAWTKVMKGILPVAVTNPVFVDADGGGYKAPGL